MVEQSVPPQVGETVPVDPSPYCYKPLGRNHLSEAQRVSIGATREVVCTLRRGHPERFHVAHCGGVVLAVVWEDPALLLPEGM